MGEGEGHSELQAEPHIYNMTVLPTSTWKSVCHGLTAACPRTEGPSTCPRWGLKGRKHLKSPLQYPGAALLVQRGLHSNPCSVYEAS